MKPSEKCKAAGLKSLKELESISGISEQTLINWDKHKPWSLDAVIFYAAHCKQLTKPNNQI